MPGAPRAAVSANYQAALYFSTREPKKERGGERGGLGISGFNLLYFQSFQNSGFVRIISVIKWLPLKKTVFSSPQATALYHF